MYLTSDNEVQGDRVGAVEVLHGEGVGSAVHLAHTHQGQPGQVAVGQLQVGTHIRTQIRQACSSLPPPRPPVLCCTEVEKPATGGKREQILCIY